MDAVLQFTQFLPRSVEDAGYNGTADTLYVALVC
jgi:hypothetical protein